MRNNDDDLDLNPPPKLLEALRRVSRKEVFVPRTVDEAILKAARGHLAPSRRSWFHWPRLLIATAAVVLAMGVLLWVVKPSKRPSDILVEDVNGDGRVNILDAFALARCLKSSPTACSKYDINGDGVIDQRDIEILAARAVRLDKQSGS